MKPCKSEQTHLLSGRIDNDRYHLVGAGEEDGQNSEADDRPLLEKIASQVKPIMVKRNWTVGTLGEVRPLLSSGKWLMGSSSHRILLY